MSLPDDLHYTADHEWVRMLPDGTAELGITDYAQQALGDIVFVQLPAPGTTMTTGQAVAEVESVKSVSEIYAPLSGEVTEANEALDAAPETINADAYGAGWLLRFRPEGPVDALLDATAYAAGLTDT